MGEYIAASIKFGGRLSADKVDELIDLLNDKTMHENSSEQAPPSLSNLGAEFYDHEINFGNLDELLDFAHKNGLDYRYWHDGGCEWSPTTYRYYASGERLFELPTLHDGRLAVPLNLIRQLGSFEKVMHYVSCVQMDPMPLEIVP